MEKSIECLQGIYISYTRIMDIEDQVSWIKFRDAFEKAHQDPVLCRKISNLQDGLTVDFYRSLFKEILALGGLDGRDNN